MRVLIVAPNISMRMGGEAVLPFHYIREFKKARADWIAITHARVRDELISSEIYVADRFYFIEDSPLEKMVHRLGRLAPGAIREKVFLTLIAAITSARLAKYARALARTLNVDVIHQTTPVSPKFPSFLTNMPAPVIIGPMNGGMEYPPAFKNEYAQGSGATIAIARAFSGIANTIAPGKKHAAKILVANERSRKALPGGIDPVRVSTIVENGVDLDLWSPNAAEKSSEPIFVFVGRLVWLKGVELMIEAFARAPSNARLVIIGDGPERARFEQAANQSSAADRIEFLGFRPQSEIKKFLGRATALILPSLRECGGSVILEAAACGTTSIATDWGGPKDYITSDTGILVAPDGREEFILGLTAAITQLAEDVALAKQLGERASANVEASFSWRAKAQRMIEIYEDAAPNP